MVIGLSRNGDGAKLGAVDFHVTLLGVAIIPLRISESARWFPGEVAPRCHAEAAAEHGDEGAQAIVAEIDRDNVFVRCPGIAEVRC